jgi:hypothetical protein
MTRHLRSTTALGLALLAVAAPAAARAASGLPAHVPVPAGQLQHTVIETFYPQAKNTQAHDTVRYESWMTAHAGRALESNVTTGKVKSDCQFRLGHDALCWTYGHPGVIHINPGDPSFLISWADRARIEKGQLALGMHLTGKTTYLGRPALTYVQDPDPTARGGTVTVTETVDAKTDYPLREETTIVSGNNHYDQILETKVMKLIRPHGVQLTMNPHPKARRVNDLAQAKKSAAAP